MTVMRAISSSSELKWKIIPVPMLLFSYLLHTAYSLVDGENAAVMANKWNSTAPSSMDCLSGADLAAAFVNPSVNVARILVNMILMDSDWEMFAVPVLLQRNVTVTGPHLLEPADYPVLDMGYVRGKVWMEIGNAGFSFLIFGCCCARVHTYYVRLLRLLVGCNLMLRTHGW
ncbi:hypothetical protein Vretimale_7112 [Volvox reticuliferus]|uniref:Uncharacterized protein n=1 Tax=Volvox reticuliferus TaxID=1737510 RepID=A0A8J4G8B0_9CHLO|nr:hypothetical protein Vretifemale_11039 [Volvox reticuliferus]GIM02191.1 hypothetical protein Vretimale_7112 [Volvox reticuliferus]